MLTVHERTLSGLRVMSGAEDPFVDAGDPYATDVAELIAFLDTSALDFTFERDGDQVVGRGRSAAGVLTHQMVVRGETTDLDLLCPAAPTTGP